MKKGLVIISFAFIFLLSMSIIISANYNQDNQDEKISFGEWLKGLWGKITGKAVATSYSCIDSDGNNINIKGDVTISSSNSPMSISTDVCMGSLAVTEYTCSSSTASTATATLYSCPSGYSCDDGACKLVVNILPIPISTCFDSDGDNITVKGNVTTPNNPLSVDFCASSSTVTEYTCSSPTASQPTATIRLCQSGFSCNDGVCFCSPNYVKTSCVNEVAVFKDANACGVPDYTLPYDCDGNGVISEPSCSGINLNADGSGVLIDFLPFNNLINYTGIGNKTIQLAEDYQGVEFDWDFSDEFNFCGVSLETSDENDDFGYVVFNYSDGGIKNKIAFVDRINESNRVCIKDASVANISEISAKCNASNEILIKCPGNFSVSNPTYNYNCTIVTDDSGFEQYQVWPLKHSAVKEIFSITGLVSGSGTGNFTNLTNQTETGETGECIPDWTCANYGKCVDGFKKRVCTDSNNCGVETDKPSETSECKKSSLLIILLAIAGLILIIFLIMYFMKRGKSDEESFENKTHYQASPPRSPPPQTNVYAHRTPLASQR